MSAAPAEADSGKAVPSIETPILSDESEEFFHRLASDDGPHVPLPQDPPRGAQTRDLGGADQVPLPMSPPAGETKRAGEKSPKGKNRAREYFGFIQSKIGPLPFTKEYKKKQAGTNLHDVATAVKSGESLDITHDPNAPKHQVDQEEEDLGHVLDKLNLAAVNNKAFSLSDKSNELMQEFVQILKDCINGVPTAYDDLENLLTNRDKDLREMYDKMPPFLQKLIKSLPTKMSATVLPGLMAAASEKPGADGKHLNVSSQTPKSKSKRTIPSLKSLVQGDVVATMLRSILNFLKLRFPVLLSGTNILVSLAVFLLLFVFWYCHKRGKEVRLEKERRATEGQSDLSSASEFDSSVSDDEAVPQPKDAGPKGGK